MALHSHLARMPWKQGLARPFPLEARLESTRTYAPLYYHALSSCGTCLQFRPPILGDGLAPSSSMCQREELLLSATDRYCTSRSHYIPTGATERPV